MSQTIPLHLTVYLQPSDLKVQLQNPTDHPVRVWDLGTSWGGAAWSVGLTTGGGGGRALTLRPTKQPYTVNFPRYIDVPARGQREIHLAPSGLEWTFGEDLSGLAGVPLHVRVVLEIAPSKEAAEQKVATGRVESAEVVSQPPYTWLFGAAAP